MANEATIATVLQLVDALNAGQVTVDELRERARSVPEDQVEDLLAWVDLAEMLHMAAQQRKRPTATVPVKNPRFRKGTSRRVVRWKDCLWQPPGAAL